MATLQPVRSDRTQRALVAEHKAGSNEVGVVARNNIRSHSTRGRGFHAVEMHTLSFPEFQSLIHEAAKDGRISLVNSLLKSHLAPKSTHRLSENDLFILLKELSAVKDSAPSIELILQAPPDLSLDEAGEIMDIATRSENWDALLALVPLEIFGKLLLPLFIPLRKAIGERLIQAAIAKDGAAIARTLEAGKKRRLFLPVDLGQALKAACEAGYLDGAALILSCDQQNELTAADSAEILWILSSKAQTTPRDLIPISGTYGKKEPVVPLIRQLRNLDAAAIGRALEIATERRSLPLIRYFLLQAGNNIPPEMQGTCLLMAANHEDQEVFNLFSYADFLKTAPLHSLGKAASLALQKGHISMAKLILSSERLAKPESSFLENIDAQTAIAAFETHADALGYPSLQILFIACLRGGLMVGEDQLMAVPLPTIVIAIEYSLRIGTADMAMHLLTKRRQELDSGRLESLFILAIETSSSDPRSPNWKNAGFIKLMTLLDWFETTPCLSRAFDRMTQLGLDKPFEILEKTRRFEEIVADFIPNFQIAARLGHAALIQAFLRCAHSDLISLEILMETLLLAAETTASVDAILEVHPNLGIERILRPILSAEPLPTSYEWIALRMVQMDRFKDFFSKRENRTQLLASARRHKMTDLAAAL